MSKKNDTNINNINNNINNNNNTNNEQHACQDNQRGHEEKEDNRGNSVCSRGGWSILDNNLIKERLYYREIPPGLGLYILPKKGYQKKYAVFSTRFGSIDSKFRLAGEQEYTNIPDGVAHFLEHKLFEDEQGDVFHRFAALGASANAFTSFTQTAYLFSCTDMFYENLAILLDFVQNPYFTEETVRKEQGIIGQEIRMYEDNPQWRLFFNSLEALYQAHPVRQDIAGTVESISRITPDILYECYRTFYHPGNMDLFVVGGDIDPDKIGEQVTADLARRNYRPQGKVERYYPEEKDAVNQKRVTQKMVVAEPLINIAFKDTSPQNLSSRDKLRRMLSTGILMDVIFSDSEPLYHSLYEANLIGDDFDAGYVQELNYAHSMLGGETSDPGQLYDKILQGLADFRKTGVAGEQVERHRRAKLGGFMQRFNSLEFIANSFLSNRYRGVDFFSIPELLQKITVEEVNNRLAEHLDPDNHVVSIIEPSS